MDSDEMLALSDTPTQHCTQHKGEQLRYYCKSHDQLGCQRCLTTDHTGCQTSNVTDECTGVVDSSEYKQLLSKLKSLELKCDSTIELSRENADHSNEYHYRAVEEMRKLVSQHRDHDLKRLDSVSNTALIMKEKIRAAKAELIILERNKRNSALFVAMKKKLSHMQRFEQGLCKLEAENNISRYMLKEMDEPAAPGKRLGLPLEIAMLPVLAGCINVRTSSSDQDCYLSGFCLLPQGNQLVSVDHNNKKIRLVNLQTNMVGCEVKLSDQPWDVTRIKETELAVTLPSAKKIQFLIKVAHTKLGEGRKINVTGACYGIFHNDGTLVVTFLNPGKVQVLGMDGAVLKNIEKDARGAQLFDNPLYVVINQSKTGIYVSDRNKNTVTCVATDGAVRSVYSDKHLKNARGVTVDRNGVMYVCGHESNNIHQITSECSKMQVLLGHDPAPPFSMVYSDIVDKLYVGVGAKGIVNVYQMK